MSSRMLALLIVPMLALTGCLRFAETRTVVWAKMGTPAKIVDDRQVLVLTPDGEGGWKPGRADLSGMIAIDEPTLEYFQGLEAKEQ